MDILKESRTKVYKEGYAFSYPLWNVLTGDFESTKRKSFVAI